ncbi:MAG: CBS domain-containing protein [Cellulophaga sp.]|uniref:CBS domain-containing protein n=2 Tax=Cellulophaga TaxID=104264 RepID=UPI000C2B691C|nr:MULTISPECIES: CBS domain-containing protein [unclassified Cellulophaga]MDO6490352.1 CBS domain-containing protein [Cellulophaga sp. 2_MG-2023]MDO6494454.1 CBS domain-containing protein [Cellulophaga sp. 3_MG-2023]PKB42041.1 CBS domain protein [Cellulophaga sp. RHA19]
MQIQSNILSTIPTFSINDSMEEVIRFFKTTTFSHVAVVDKSKLVGMIAENDFKTFEKGKKIEDYKYNLETFCVDSDTSWLDVLEVFSKNDANILPVLDKDEAFVGYYDLTDIVALFIGTPFFTEPGGILVVAKGISDYSFSEIAQIVESNNAKLYGAFITEIENDVAQVTLKITSANLNEITQSFRRYNYSILYGNDDDLFLEDLKERSNYLDKYLNV